MNIVGVISAAVLSLTLGAAAPAYAQQEQHDQKEEQKAKPAQQEEGKKRPDKPKQEEKSAQQQNKNAKQQEEKNTQQHAQQTNSGQQAQRSSGNGGGRIPDDRFRANFGREHTFRVTQAEYTGGRRFQYGGYWFGFIDAWPANWLYTQDVYVVDINGVYYLCNPAYPGINILLSVTL